MVRRWEELILVLPSNKTENLIYNKSLLKNYDSQSISYLKSNAKKYCGKEIYKNIIIKEKYIFITKYKFTVAKPIEP